MTKKEKKEALQKIEQELEAVEKRLLQIEIKELQEALKRWELKYSQIEEERNILKQILQDIRKATSNIGKLYKSDKQKAFLKSLPEDDL